MSFDDEKYNLIEGRLEENARASTSLREAVEGLQGSLDAIADLKREQVAIRSAADEAAKQAKAVQVQSATRAARARRAAAFVTVVLLLLAGSTFWNKRAIEASQARWCPVVVPLAPRASDPPPVGTPEQQERALRIRVAFSKLVHDFDC